MSTMLARLTDVATIGRGRERKTLLVLPNTGTLVEQKEKATGNVKSLRISLTSA